MPVFHVHAGPSVSSAALVVTSLNTEAGLTPKSAFQPQDGAGASTGCTHSASAFCGTWASASAVATDGGSDQAGAARAGRAAQAAVSRARAASRVLAGM